MATKAPSEPATVVTLQSQKPLQKSLRKRTFIVCELCHGFILDNFFKDHMEWIHEVQLQSDWSIGKPPLQCKRCVYKFFTTQGLEKHTLYFHGRITFQF